MEAEEGETLMTLVMTGVRRSRYSKHAGRGSRIQDLIELWEMSFLIKPLDTGEAIVGSWCVMSSSLRILTIFPQSMH